MKKRLAAFVFLFFVLLTGRSASATILFAGGEDTSFTFIGATPVVSTTANTYRSSYSREEIELHNTNTVADPPASRIQTATFTAGPTVWVHAQVYMDVSTTVSGQQGLIVRSPDAVSRIVVRGTGAAGQLKVSKRNAAGTITDLATATGNYNAVTIMAFDLFVNYTCSGAGGVQLYLAGVQVINYSGSPCTDAATTLNQVELAGLAGASGTPWTRWSEVIIADADTRSMALWTLSPPAAGNTQSWTPNTVADVNPTTINDANNVTTGSNNALSEWTTPTSAPTGYGNWTVKAIVEEARVESVGGSGPKHFEWLTRTGGSNFVTGSIAPTSSFVNYSNQIWATNPNTSAAWAITDIAAGFNLGIESLN